MAFVLSVSVGGWGWACVLAASICTGCSLYHVPPVCCFVLFCFFLCDIEITTLSQG